MTATVHAPSRGPRDAVPRGTDGRTRGRTLLRVGGRTVFGLLVVLLVGLVAVPAVLGLETRTVISGSMEPAIPTGSVALIRPAEATPPAVGDVVLFASAGQQHDVLHRAVGTRELEGVEHYVTRGDANARDDPWLVAPDEVIGTVVAHVPHLGHLAALQGSRRLLALVLAAAALVIVAMEIPFWYRFIRYGRAAFEPTDAAVGADPSPDAPTTGLVRRPRDRGPAARNTREPA